MENLVSEKSLGFGLGKFGIRKKVLVSVSVKSLVSSFSAHHVFLSADFPMEEECYGEEKMAILAIGATILNLFFVVQGCKINDCQEL